jgi:DNA-binding transcriptional MerR regulator
MFKIGEFSTIARVSIHLLRHYDEIDLFKPRHVDEATGYRYYAIEQLAGLNRILSLRDLGFSLPEIEKMIREEISIEEIRGMLRMRRSQIENSIQEEQTRLRRVSARLEQVQRQGGAGDYEPVLKDLPQQYFLSIRESVANIRNSGGLYYEVSEAVLGQSVISATHCMAIFHDPYFLEHETDFELGYLLSEGIDLKIPLKEGRSLTVKNLDPITDVLTCIHQGPWPKIHHGFAALGEWMSNNQMQIAGRPRELYLNLVPPEEDENLVVEIQIPVAGE